MSRQMNNAEDLKPRIVRSSSNGSASPTASRSLSTDVKQTDSRAVAGDKRHSPSRASKATGPRTTQGKERSKNNATRHGIFSKVVVLKSESRVEFDALLHGLRNDFQPVGKFEELLVEKLAILFWRGRRLLIAEAAEIPAEAKFVVEWDGKERDREEAGRLPQLSCNGGLIRWIANRVALQGCLDLLGELKERIDARGFTPEMDQITLTKLYGRYDEENYHQPLFRSYLLYCGAASFSAEECRQKGLPSPEESKEAFLGEVKQEIKRLRQYEKEQAKVEASKSELEALRQNVPDVSQLDRLLRYETSLERSIDRTLNQLERAQRMRLGQPAPPRIDVNISPS